MRALALLFLLVACDRSTKQARTVTCDEAKPALDAAAARAEESYRKALAAKQLKLAALERLNVGGVHGVETPEALAKLLGQPAREGDIIPYDYAHKTRSAIVGEVVTMQTTKTADFVEDANRGVWRVVRAPRTRVVDRLRVKACAWGCGTKPPDKGPPESFSRLLHFLADGQHYRGDVSIAYDAPTVELQIERMPCEGAP